jgi:hypothetical protein
MFGHPIQLNFNKKGTSKNTLCGGILSVCLKIAILVYVILNVKRLILRENDDLMQEIFLQKKEELEGVDINWHDLQFEFTPSIKKVRNDRLGEFVYNDESRRFVELIYAIHKTEIIDGKR